MEKIEELKKAIEVCESMRGTASKLIKASPVQIHIYNVFTSAKIDLKSLLANLEDVLDIYNKETKNG